MLLSFVIKNVLSFKEMCELSMVSTRGKELPEQQFCIEKNTKSQIHINKFAFLFGPNAGGKSNFLAAFTAMAQIVNGSGIESAKEMGGRYNPFKLSQISLNEPSIMQVIFLIDNIIYRYGFEFDRSKFIDEWLWAKKITDKNEECIFCRNQQNRYSKDHESYSDFLENDKHVYDTSLILTVNKSLKNTLCEKIAYFFSNISSEVTLEMAINDITQDMIDALISLLKYADVGINGFENSETVQNEDTISELPEVLRTFFAMAIKDGANIKERNIYFYHIGDETSEKQGYKLSVNEESKGTKKFLSLALQMISVIKTGGILVIDEFEDGLHPILLQGLIKFFSDLSTNGAQLICSSHCHALINQKTLRRDSIWFVEKNILGESSAICASDYELRPDASLRKLYENGVLNGIPRVQNGYLEAACKKIRATF